MGQADTNTTPQKYRPDPRLIDQSEKLRHLYCERDLSIREIVNNHAETSVERVYHALDEYDLLDNGTDTQETADTLVWTD